eukprot:Nk52_evm93s226 gene=Nk52_evmTU93s226
MTHTVLSVSPENVAEADALKDKANGLFKEGKYLQAIEFYTKSIELNPNVPAVYSNRAFSYIKTECFGYALEDAAKCLELDKGFIKGYYRRASANMGLGKFKESLKDLRSVCKRVPNDRDARMKLKECDKIVKKEAFELAIQTDKDKKSAFDTLDIDSLAVDSSYTGPKLVDGKVTLEFVKEMMTCFKNQKLINKKYAYQILSQARDLFKSLPSLVDIDVPEGTEFTICGDVHGQYYDLLNIFELNGLPSESNPYLFNGDFVDRGSFSVEVIFTLFAFKLLYPNHFHMSRGNHETINMNKMYGFDGEVKSKFNDTMCEMFHETYRCLPLAQCIGKSIIVVHGGLFSRDDVTLDDIRKIDRFCEPGDSGLMCELLWSDPQDAPGRSPSKRGVGYQFGPDVTENFLNRNGLSLLIRSHEVKDNGYEIAHNGKCITVFSAPNYCDQMGNKGAFIKVSSPSFEPKITSFDAVPHPSIKPMAYASNFGMFGL